MVFLLLEGRHQCDERLVLAIYAYVHEHCANLLAHFEPVPWRHTVVHDDQLKLWQVISPCSLIDLDENF